MSGPPSHRTCKKCEETKPLEAFSKDPAYKWGRRYICQSCKNALPRNKGTQPNQALVTEHVLSLGAGIQSSVLHMMSDQGLLPRLHHSIFADTGWEPKHVYEQVDWLEKNSSIPIFRVNAGNIRDDAITGQFVTMPMLVENGDRAGILSRQCTGKYKVQPIRSHIARAIGGQYRTIKLCQWLGISTDEAHRMKDSDVAYIENVYPLIDLGMTRDDCIHWWEEQGYPPFRRSACIGCPFHSDADWLELSPEELQDAIEFERAIQEALADRLDGQVFLHQSMKPLDQVVFNPTRKTADLFGQECQGMCGI